MFDLAWIPRLRSAAARKRPQEKAAPLRSE
jgi:hypothetical protein